MSTPLDLAQSRLLLPSGLDLQGLDRAFGTLLGPGIDFGDLYFQHSRRESWTVEDGIVKDGAHSIEQGVGVRAISGEKTGFAYSDDIHAQALLDAAGTAASLALHAELGRRGWLTGVGALTIAVVLGIVATNVGLRQPVRRVVMEPVAAPLRLQRQGEGGVARDVQRADMVHLDGDG